jgi:hypothetical protein
MHVRRLAPVDGFAVRVYLRKRVRNSLVQILKSQCLSTSTMEKSYIHSTFVNDFMQLAERIHCARALLDAVVLVQVRQRVSENPLYKMDRRVEDLAQPRT